MCHKHNYKLNQVTRRTGRDPFYWFQCIRCRHMEIVHSKIFWSGYRVFFH